MTFWVPSLPSKYFRHYISLFSQHHKFDVDLLSYFLDAKLKHCSEMKLKTKSSVTGLSKSEHLVMD